MVETILEALDLERGRFELVWCSSAEAERFADAVRAMTKNVRELGPSPYRKDCEPAPAPAPAGGEVGACR